MRSPGDAGESGFTLIELMIVVAVIAILAGIAIPNLLSSKTAANESAAVATLRSVATAQYQFKASGDIDRNGDQNSEYATLAELSGSAPLRGSGATIDPRLLSASMGLVDAQGRVQRQGYLFQVYLPDAAGVGQPETAAALPTVDPVQAQYAWSVLAWPIEQGRSGRAAFFLNQHGDILKAPRATYSGTSSVPPAGAALTGVPPSTIVGGALAVYAAGADGNQWVPVR